ncbi:MAG: hypothetical protein JNL38_27475 [Myxococcales bacterium]|nr:hypothetical protein [Myxococcales bacterium]
MRRASFAAAAGTLACACSLVVAGDGRGPGGAGAAPASDAPPASDAGGGSDARVSTDAAAAGDADGGRGSPCARTHLFCADFEDDDPRVKWTNATAPGLCDVATDPSSPSPTRLLRCATSTVTTAERFRKEVPIADGRGFTVDVDLSMAVPDAGPGFEIDPLTFAATGSAGTAFIALAVYRGDPTRTSFEYNHRLPDGGVEYLGIPVPIPRDGTFHHLRVTFASSPPSATIELDGVAAGKHALDPLGAIDEAVVQVGLTYLDGPPPPSVVRIDDVVVDELP